MLEQHKKEKDKKKQQSMTFQDEEKGKQVC